MAIYTSTNLPKKPEKPKKERVVKNVNQKKQTKNNNTSSVKITYTKPTQVKKVEHKKKRKKASFNIALFLLCLSSIILLLITFPIIKVVQLAILGVFGLFIYPLLSLVIVLCIFSILHKKIIIHKRFVLLLSIALVSILTLVQLVMSSNLNMDSLNIFLSDTYQKITAGGILISLLVYPFVKVCTMSVTYLIFSMLLMLDISFLIDHIAKSNLLGTTATEYRFLNEKEENCINENVGLKNKQEQSKIENDINKEKIENENQRIISTTISFEEYEKENSSRPDYKREYIMTPVDINSINDEDDIFINNNKKVDDGSDNLFVKTDINNNDYNQEIKPNYDKNLFANSIEDKSNININFDKDLAENKYENIDKNNLNNKYDFSQSYNKKTEEKSIKNLYNNYANNLEKNQDKNQDKNSPNIIDENIESNINNIEEKNSINNFFNNIENDKINIENTEKNNELINNIENNIENIEKNNELIDNIENIDENNYININNSLNNINDNIDNNSLNNIDNNSSNEYFIKDVFKDSKVDDNIDDVLTNNIDQNNTSIDSQNNDSVDSQNDDYSSRQSIDNHSSNISNLNKKNDNEFTNLNLPMAPYVRPPHRLLNIMEKLQDDSEVTIDEKIDRLENVLESFRVPAKVIAVKIGPAVTRYELTMPEGVSVKKIIGYSDDIAYALASNGAVRIEAPIPGKNAVGVEVPNEKVSPVSLREVFDNKQFIDNDSPLSIALGLDINGDLQFAHLDKLVHIIVAGSTGSGKSVMLNAMILNMIYKSSPENLRILLIDPKRVEFINYEGLPHLLLPNIITEREQAINALRWAEKEMERRYCILQNNRVVNLKDYQKLEAVKDGRLEKLPFIVIIIDELADLMNENKKEIEDKLRSLAQKARASGIHLVVATQRPSTDVITGTIKANFPSRIAFALTNYQDSRTVLDGGGAEKLLGKGDMLFKAYDKPNATRVQGAFVSSEEVEEVVNFVKENNPSVYNENIANEILKKKEYGDTNVSDMDILARDVMEMIIDTNISSANSIVARFEVGFPRATRILMQLERKGWVSPVEGNKPRRVLITKERLDEFF